MFGQKKLTLLIIPEEGGRTHEFKVHKLYLWLLLLGAAALSVLLVVGLYGYARARDLALQVEDLQRQRALLQDEVGQIEQLEQVLGRLQRRNEQLRAILGESDASAEGDWQGNAASGEPFISAVQRLRWGHVESVPTAWPLAGRMARAFSAEFPAVFIAAPVGTPVCASASGHVRRAGFDERLGHVLVIDHGNGLSTYYGYNGHLLAAVGEYVFKGQCIALSGRSGQAPQPGLYYALEEAGRFRDPVRYRLWL